MATLRVNNIDKTTMRKLKERAEMHGRSPANELREIIAAELKYAWENDAKFRRAVLKDRKNYGSKRRRRG